MRNPQSPVHCGVWKMKRNASARDKYKLQTQKPSCGASLFFTSLQIKKKVGFSTSGMVPLGTNKETVEGLGVELSYRVLSQHGQREQKEK